MTSVSISLMKKRSTTTLGQHHGGVRLDTSLMTGRVCGAGERGARDPSPLKQNLGDAPDLCSYYIKLCLLLFYQRNRKKYRQLLNF